MLRLALFSFAAIVLSLAVIACGGDDDATPTTSPSITVGASSPAAGTTAPADDGKTEGPSASPAAVTVAPTAPGDIPTAPPVASEGTPAVAPDDEGLFIGQFQGQPIDTEACTYNPTTALVTCPGRGLYAIDPPLVGQDISCNIWIVSGVEEVIQCTVIGPDDIRDTTNYEIME
ncbi:MAG: hypothetical protein IIC25_06630 [Chloroflexi bacterium]|nr:hypothetical protein [Chloroflexota bacterium]